MQAKTSTGESDSEVEVVMTIADPKLLSGQRLVLFVKLPDAATEHRSLPFMFKHVAPTTTIQTSTKTVATSGMTGSFIVFPLL